jgi:prevent-host-death family protein
MSWNISEAKNRLSEVLTRADAEAQTIVRRDRDYVVMAGDEYRKMTGREQSFTDFLIDAGPRFDEMEPMKREALAMRDAGL